MGAYSQAARRVSRRLAEELISTGESHTAEWLHEKELVDRVFQQGEAFVATHHFIDSLLPRLNGIRAMLRTRRRVLPITKSELMDVTEDWAESAFHLQEQDLAYMERLVMLQNRRVTKHPIALVASEARDASVKALLVASSRQSERVLEVSR